MDVIILAAGRGSRLRGVVPAYAKPLMPISGVPIIITCIRAARDAGHDRVVIVASPKNVEALTELLDAHDLDVEIVLQWRPHGPADALLRGLQSVHSDRVIVLCGDNIMTAKDVELVARTSGEVVVGGKIISEGADRFTRVTDDGKTIEGVPGGVWTDGHYRCWLGPLGLPTDRTREVLSSIKPRQKEWYDRKIGPYLADIGHVQFVHTNVIDVGTIEDVGLAATFHTIEMFNVAHWHHEALMLAMIVLGHPFECEVPDCRFGDERAFIFGDRQRMPVIDHILARTQEGDNRPENLRFAHDLCNHRPHERSPEESAQIVQTRRENGGYKVDAEMCPDCGKSYATNWMDRHKREGMCIGGG